MAKHKVVDRFEEIKKLEGVKSEYVYVMVNESIPRMIKLGATSDILERYRQIRGTLPGKTRCMWFREVVDMFAVEKKARDRLSPYQATHCRDWFECPVHVAIGAFDFVLKNIEHKQVDIQSLKLRSTPVRVDRLKDLGQYCREWRKKHRMTLEQVAGLAGVGVRFVSEFERGKSTCQFDLCLKMCEYMGVDVYAARRSKS